MKEEKQRVALYARVSKDETVNDNRYQNPENQLHMLRKYAEQHNFEVVVEYIDKCSGASTDRPEFKRMFDEIYTKGFKHILVWKLDRFSREPMLMVLHHINMLRFHRVGLTSITETWLDISEDNPVSELILAVMSWFAGEERRKISERTKAAIQRQKQEGTYKGGRPKGKKDKKPRKKAGYYNKKRGAKK